LNNYGCISFLYSSTQHSKIIFAHNTHRYSKYSEEKTPGPWRLLIKICQNSNDVMPLAVTLRETRAAEDDELMTYLKVMT